MKFTTFTLLASLLLSPACATVQTAPETQKPVLHPKVVTLATYAKALPLEVKPGKDSRGIKDIYIQQVTSNDYLISVHYIDRSVNGNDKPNGIIGPEDDFFITLGIRTGTNEYRVVEEFLDTGLDGLNRFSSDYHIFQGRYCGKELLQPEHAGRFEALLDKMISGVGKVKR